MSILPRTYPRAMAQRAARYLTESGAVEASDSTHLIRVLEEAMVEELFLESRLRDEAQALVDSKVGRGVTPTGGADLDVLRERIVAKLAQDRGRVLR